MPKDKNRKQKRAKQVRMKRRRDEKLNTAEGLARRGSKGQWVACLISTTWVETTSLTQIVACRKLHNAQHIMALFMVDPGCLGIKSGYVREVSPEAYRNTVRKVGGVDPLESCDPALAVRVLETTRAYAADFGFEADPDAIDALPIFDDVDPESCVETVPVGGPEGKPYYVAGPHDDVEKIMNQLQRKFGDDGFHAALPS